MATHLDLEEQEQLDELKHFWKTYGNLITWVLIAVSGTFAAWNAYQYWDRSQSVQAVLMFDEVERSAVAGDLPRLERSISDMKEKFAGTSYAQQAVLLDAKVFFEKDKLDAAKASLVWVGEKSSDAGYSAIARLRLASLLISQKAYDDALKQLAGSFPKDFDALVADHKGDALSLQQKKSEAIAEYEKAYSLFDGQSEYRRLVEVKLIALGVDPLTDKNQAVNQISATPSGDKK
jgi:predicted negative regulator of RcsB-dependent stress response